MQSKKPAPYVLGAPLPMRICLGEPIEHHPCTYGTLSNHRSFSLVSSHLSHPPHGLVPHGRALNGRRTARFTTNIYIYKYHTTVFSVHKEMEHLVDLVGRMKPSWNLLVRLRGRSIPMYSPQHAYTADVKHPVCGSPGWSIFGLSVGSFGWSNSYSANYFAYLHGRFLQPGDPISNTQYPVVSTCFHMLPDMIPTNPSDTGVPACPASKRCQD